ncbi:CBS domain-containing protein [Fuerstiella marisgermanici]|uniref:Putative manganese-dependent inorganic pyrophosphatase n=1 Tax=Fuerstiella marisgermanici TaxID=1891926 RepID=A0A1P8WEB8_9PLAN|nr:CBS domain-containing protein [Fuerstiella marisgermanici]APZ92390.1 putative manganese-dependent inorganic pyrophosphatase [Fuerstiella marisgermanici]
MQKPTITAADIMTRHLAITTPETHVMQAIERLIAQRVSGLPVIDAGGRFVGRFSERTAIAALDLGFVEKNRRAMDQLRQVTAADIMDRAGAVLSADQDVFESASELITRRVSGAPVIDEDGTLLGVFSEQSAMHVFIGLCWEQLPSSRVSAWLDRHDDRRIAEDTGLDEILQRFQDTPYRRLMVLHGPKLVGQITRRDALAAALQHSREPLAASMQVPGENQLGVKTIVVSWMQREAESVAHDADVLAIARLFLRSEARQLPVLDGDRLDGQISRSDLLRAVQRFFPGTVSDDAGAQPLYLSSVNKRDAHAVMK